MEALDIIKKIVSVLDDRLAKNIKVIDIKGISIMADYFVVASANNINHIQALADYLEDELRKLNIHYTHMEGFKSCNWILMDYGDIVVHIFDEPSREFYDLERIWRDGKIIEVPL